MQLVLHGGGMQRCSAAPRRRYWQLADSDDASSTTQRFVNVLASAPVILRSDASKAGPVKAR